MTGKTGYVWHLRRLMAEHGMFATTDLGPLLAMRGVCLSREQVYRLVTRTPERLSLATLAALCDILGCEPNDLFEPFVEMRAAASANAPRRSEDIGVRPGNPIARRIRLIPDAGDKPGHPGKPGE